jgi:hypothetical protein
MNLCIFHYSGPDRNKVVNQKGISVIFIIIIKLFIIFNVSIILDYLSSHYPFIEYWLSCNVTSRDINLIRPLSIDHPNTTQLNLKGLEWKRNERDIQKNIYNDNNNNHMKIDNTIDSKIENEINNNISNNQDKYLVQFIINSVQGDGTVILEINPKLSPLGAARFKELVVANYFTDARFYRVIKGFMAQFGIGSSPSIHRQWYRFKK